MSENSNVGRCGKCGAALSGYAPDGLCAACLLESAFEEQDVGTGEPSKAVPLLSFKDYELLEEIARGGMGVVYRARQISLNRAVAIKMILGGHLANAAEMQRFRTEAATAAQLQHPNIVAIHEVGEHAGQPFFSMDLVKGRNLAESARNEPLPSRRAAAYLKTIAEAVAYAHSRGVLHRDLKPSNILIDESDQPRITDFGLAKRLDAQLSTADAQLTQTGQVLGSPSFIPPEQAAGQKEAIGPASDVYSLGAILYYLLTGRPPFAAETLPATLRMVAENEPVSPRLLNASVPRDLETICLRCLEKEPKRRYVTAQELANDLNCFFRDEPIQARRASSVEKAFRWCRRKPALATALLLVLVVAIGSPIAAWRINRERLQAQSKERKAQAMLSFLALILEGVGPSRAHGRDTTMLKEILDTTAERVGKDFKNEPEIEADLRIVLGKTYGDLGFNTNALGMTREALRLRRQVHPGSENIPVADALANLGAFLYDTGDLAGAEKADRDALAMRIKLLGVEHTNVAMSYNNLGVCLWNQNKLSEAEEVQQRALEVRRKLLPATDPAVGMSLLNLANVHAAQGKFASVEADYLAALDIFCKCRGNEDPLVATLRNNLAIFISQRGELSAAEKMHRGNLELRKKIFKVDHPHIAISYAQLGILLTFRGELQQAEAALQDALDMQNRLHLGRHIEVADSLAGLGMVMLKKGDWVAAEQTNRLALQIRRELMGDYNPDVADSRDAIALVAVARGDLKGAEDQLLEAVDAARKSQGSEPTVIPVLYHLGWVLREQGQVTNANTQFREARAIAVKHGPYGAWPLLRGIHDLADVLQRQGKFAEAEPLLLDGVEYLTGHEGENAVLKRDIFQRLTVFYDAWDRAKPNMGKGGEAVVWRKKLEKLDGLVDENQL